MVDLWPSCAVTLKSGRKFHIVGECRAMSVKIFQRFGGGINERRIDCVPEMRSIRSGSVMKKIKNQFSKNKNDDTCLYTLLNVVPVLLVLVSGRPGHHTRYTYTSRIRDLLEHDGKQKKKRRKINI